MTMQTDLTTTEKQLLQALQTIADETRYKMFRLMSSGQELCVSQIATELGVSVSAISQHFRLFEMAGMVNKTRYGQKICYTLKGDSPLVTQLIALPKEA